MSQWKLMMPLHEKTGLATRPKASTPMRKMRPRPQEEGPGARLNSAHILDRLLVPRDPRGIVLACGFVGVAVLGISALISGDPIGFAYLLAAAGGYFFLQTRLFPAALWVMVGLGGGAVAAAGNPSGWIVAVVALALAGVSLLPIAQPETSRNPEVRAKGAGPSIQAAQPARPESSRNLEVSQSPQLTAIGPPNGTKPSKPQTAHRVIKTIGRLTLEVDGRDATKRLREQPRLEFLLSYLLARAVLGSGPVDRTALAEEVAPGIATSNQLERLRKQLNPLQAALGADLKDLVRTNKTQLSLDLSGLEVDALALSDQSARLDRRRGQIDAAMADEIRERLETTAGEFLTGFEELEHQVASGRGTALQAVETARRAIAGWRAQLTRALAEYLRDTGQPQRSIAYLQAALAQSPEREDLARLLVAAYLETGQPARAEDVRAEYELSRGEVR